MNLFDIISSYRRRLKYTHSCVFDKSTQFDLKSRIINNLNDPLAIKIGSNSLIKENC